jgi:hypothetical protein
MSTKQKFKIKPVFILPALLIILSASMTSPNSFRGGNILAVDKDATPEDITISATIGVATEMTIYGYAPVGSTVSLYGSGISQDDLADGNGYFSFESILTTDSSNIYPELCLIAYIGKLSTQPVCLPSLASGYTYKIGPVILSPIISIEQNIFPLGTQVALNGTTIPNSEVSIYLAENGSRLSLIPTAHAYYLPTYTVNSNSVGKFQLNLPSNTVAKWKVYASTAYLSSDSPKSNTLSFTVESNIRYFINRIIEKIVRTTQIITTVITTTVTKTGQAAPAGGELIVPGTTASISAGEVEIVKSRLLYYAIFIEALILILLIVFISRRKKKKQK